jgi:hypothetical protein
VAVMPSMLGNSVDHQPIQTRQRRATFTRTSQHPRNLHADSATFT